MARQEVQTKLRLRCAEAALLACNEGMLPKFLLAVASALITNRLVEPCRGELIASKPPITRG